ncbi:MAG: DUF3379 family protein [Steroidobacteraceae bacterium]
MSCEDTRLLIGAQPDCAPRELGEHLQGCTDCGAFRREMQQFNDDIRRALQRPPDIVIRRAPPRAQGWRQWALAASAVLATVAMVGLWLLRPSDTLARDVVTHVEGEPQSWLSTQHVSAASIDHALQGAGVALGVTSGQIVYAHSCWFRGHYVPHLVLQTAHGPATVLILRHEQVRGRESFREAGMRGVIVPVQNGSIAVLARGGGDVDGLASQMQQDVHWLPEPRKD